MVHVARSETQDGHDGDPSGRSKVNLTMGEERWPFIPHWVAAEGQVFEREKSPFSPANWTPATSLDATVLADTCSELKLEPPDDETELMDAGIWSALPEDLTEKVLAWLPLTSGLRFRSVCSRWNSFLSSASSVTSFSSSPRRSCFLLCTIGQAACSFDPSLSRWLFVLKPTSPGASVVASSRSLFCLGNQVAECKMLSVCNPINQSLRHLPPMLRVRLIHKVSMIEERSTNSYKILVAGEDGLPSPHPHTFNLMTEVYESSSNTWTMAGNPLPEAKFGYDPGVWCNCIFYCLTEMPYGVVMFEPTAGLWSEVDAPMPSLIVAPSLLTAKNRLLMVGRTMDGPTTAICIWEFQQRRRSWIELVAMPRSLCSKFLAPLGSSSPFVCAGVGTSIFITSFLSPQVLVYYIATNSWKWLPSDPLFPNNRDLHLLGFTFEPTFDAGP